MYISIIITLLSVLVLDFHQTQLCAAAVLDKHVYYSRRKSSSLYFKSYNKVGDMMMNPCGVAVTELFSFVLYFLQTT